MTDSRLTQTQVDLLVALGALCVVVSIASFCWALKEHYRNYRNPPSQRLCLRVLLLFPVDSIFLFLILVTPNGSPLWETCMAVTEGYAIFCFFGFMVMQAGGERATIEIMRTLESGVVFCQEKKYREDPEGMYRRIKWAVLQILWFRPLAILGAGIAEAKHRDTAPARVIALISLVYGFGWFLQMYRVVHERTKDAQVTKKIVVVKVVIILLAAQSAIIDMLFTSGVLTNDATLSEHEAEIKSRRLYALISLVEFGLLSFTIAKIYNADVFANDAEEAMVMSNLESGQKPFSLFVREVFSLLDVFSTPKVDKTPFLNGMIEDHKATPARSDGSIDEL